MRKLSVSFFFVVLFLFTCGVQDGFARKKKKGVKEVEKRDTLSEIIQKARSANGERITDHS